MIQGRQRVLKFGGAALGDGVRIRAALELVREHGGARPIVVVSALEGVTRALNELACQAEAGSFRLEPVRVRHRSVLRELDLDPELCDRLLGELARVLEAIAARGSAGPRERDFVLAMGERLSARIVAAALRGSGASATAIDAFDLGLVTDSNHGRARPDLSSLSSLRRVLSTSYGLPIVTGFVAADPRGNVTTLGPDGSDWTATLCAAAVDADEVQLWKRVGGLLTADPHVVPAARPIVRLGFPEAELLAAHGATVLHPRTVAPLVGRGIPLRLRDARDPGAAGTVIADEALRSEPVGLALQRGRWATGGSFAPSVDPGAGPCGRIALIGGAAQEVGAVCRSAGIDVAAEDRSPGVSAVIVDGSDLTGAARALHRAFFECDVRVPPC